MELLERSLADLSEIKRQINCAENCKNFEQTEQLKIKFMVGEFSNYSFEFNKESDPLFFEGIFNQLISILEEQLMQKKESIKKQIKENFNDFIKQIDNT